MSRDANGNYTLPSGNPVISGTTIDTQWANPTMSDLGSELTDSLSRTGKGGMLSPFRVPDGGVSDPALSFTQEPTSGMYRATGNDVRMSIGGADRMRWTAAGVQFWDIANSVWVNVSSSENLSRNLTGGEYSFPPSITMPSASYVKKNGSVLSRVAYPKLWAWVESHAEILVTEAEWQALQVSSPNDAVGVYSSGDTTSTFRVPTVGLGGFTRAEGSDITDPVLINIGFASHVENHKHLTSNVPSGISAYNVNIGELPAGLWGIEPSTVDSGSFRFAVAGDVFQNTSVNLEKTSPETYDNAGETTPQGQYVSVWIYTGNATDNLEDPEPEWLTQQAVNTVQIQENTDNIATGGYNYIVLTSSQTYTPASGVKTISN